MKILSSPNKIILLMLLASTVLFNYSCKKNTDLPPTTPLLTNNAQMKKWYGGNVSASFVTPINKAANELFYKNSSGNMESIYKNVNRGPDPRCDFNCFNASSPSDLYIDYTLDYAERYYLCESSTAPGQVKSNVRVKWTVTMPTTPEVVSGTNNVDNTTILVKFTDNIFNTTQTYTIPANQMTGKALGQIPNCTNGYLYEISGYATEIPDQYFQSSYTISAQLSLDIFCPIVGYVVQSSYVNGPAFSQNGYLPCNRVDKVFGVEQGSPTPYIANGMSTQVCTHPSGFLFADKHQLEYRKVTHPTSFEWEDQSLLPHNGKLFPFGIDEIPTFNINQSVRLTEITQSSGWWLVRYRNVKTGTCNQFIFNATWPDDGRWILEKVSY